MKCITNQSCSSVLSMIVDLAACRELYMELISRYGQVLRSCRRSLLFYSSNFVQNAANSNRQGQVLLLEVLRDGFGDDSNLMDSSNLDRKAAWSSVRTNLRQRISAKSTTLRFVTPPFNQQMKIFNHCPKSHGMALILIFYNIGLHVATSTIQKVRSLWDRSWRRRYNVYFDSTSRASPGQGPRPDAD